MVVCAYVAHSNCIRACVCVRACVRACVHVCACDMSDMNVFDDLCSTFVWCTTSILHYEAHNTVSTVLDISVFV